RRCWCHLLPHLDNLVRRDDIGSLEVPCHYGVMPRRRAASSKVTPSCRAISSIFWVWVGVRRVPCCGKSIWARPAPCCIAPVDAGSARVASGIVGLAPGGIAPARDDRVLVSGARRSAYFARA